MKSIRLQLLVTALAVIVAVPASWVVYEGYRKTQLHRELHGFFNLVSNGHDPEVLAIIRRNPDLVNARGPGGYTALHWACHWGRKDTAQLLLSSGADVNARNDEQGTPLHEAAGGQSEDNSEVVQLLLVNGSHVNAANEAGDTPLMRATQAHRRGRVPVLTVLLDHGADVNLANRRGLMPLHLADDDEVAALLVSRGAHVNNVDKSGKTSLHFAAMSWSQDSEGVAAFLLSAGADPNTKDNSGRTPLRVAVEADNQDVAALLRQHGAKE